MATVVLVGSCQSVIGQCFAIYLPLLCTHLCYLLFCFSLHLYLNANIKYLINLHVQSQKLLPTIILQMIQATQQVVYPLTHLLSLHSVNLDHSLFLLVSSWQLLSSNSSLVFLHNFLLSIKTQFFSCKDS